MEIRTSIFSLHKEQYFRILMYNHYIGRKFLLLWPATIVILYFFFQGDTYFTLFVVCIMVLSVSITSFQLWRFANNKENANVFTPRSVALTDGKIIVESTNDDISKFDISHIVKLKKRKDYTLLYLNKSGFIYLPKNAFDEENDYTTLIDLVQESLSKNKKQFTLPKPLSAPFLIFPPLSAGGQTYLFPGIKRR